MIKSNNTITQIKANKYSIISQQIDDQNRKIYLSQKEGQKYQLRQQLTCPMNKSKDINLINKIQRLAKRCSLYAKVHTQIFQRVKQFYIQRNIDQTCTILSICEELQVQESMKQKMSRKYCGCLVNAKKLMVDLAFGLECMHSVGLVCGNVNTRNIWKRKGKNQYVLKFQFFLQIQQFKPKYVGQSQKQQIKNEFKGSNLFAKDVFNMGIVFLQISISQLIDDQHLEDSLNQYLIRVQDLQIRSLIRGMLMKDQQMRYKSSLVLQTLKEINSKKHSIVPIAQPNIKYQTFKLHLFSSSISNSSSINQQNSIFKKKVLQKYLLTILFDSERNLIQIYLGTTSPPQVSILTEYDYQGMGDKIKNYFINARQVFNQIQTCKNNQISLDSQGNIIFNFDWQRCDLLYEMKNKNNVTVSKIKKPPIKNQSNLSNQTNESNSKHKTKKQVNNKPNQSNSPDSQRYKKSPVKHKLNCTLKKIQRAQQIQYQNKVSLENIYNEKLNMYLGLLTNNPYMYSLASSNGINIRQNISICYFHLRNYEKSLQYMQIVLQCLESKQIQNKSGNPQAINKLIIIMINILVNLLMCNKIKEYEQKLNKIKKEMPLQALQIQSNALANSFQTMASLKSIQKIKGLYHRIQLFALSQPISSQEHLKFHLKISSIIFFSMMVQYYQFGIITLNRSYAYIKSMNNNKKQIYLNQIISSLIDSINSRLAPISSNMLKNWIRVNMPENQSLKYIIEEKQQLYQKMEQSS